jgi:hypothetical protein
VHYLWQGSSGDVIGFDPTEVWRRQAIGEYVARSRALLVLESDGGEIQKQLLGSLVCARTRRVENPRVSAVLSTAYLIVSSPAAGRMNDDLDEHTTYSGGTVWLAAPMA